MSTRNLRQQSSLATVKPAYTTTSSKTTNAKSAQASSHTIVTIYFFCPLNEKKTV